MIYKILGLILITPVLAYLIVIFRATINDWPVKYAGETVRLYCVIAWFLELFGLGLYFLIK
jgi:hypothetical protein